MRRGQAFASENFGLYTGSIYLATLLGGLVADRLLGARRTVVMCALMLSAGHLAMAFDGSFVIALGLLVLGTGLLKGNISAQVGALYPEARDALRTRGFVIFSTWINIGAALGPLLCGGLAHVYGWHTGFGSAAILMLVGLATYLAGSRHYAPEPPSRAHQPRPSLTPAERHRCLVLVTIALFSIPISASYNQIGNVSLLWIVAHCSLSTAWGTVPTAWFNSIDSIASIACAPVLLALFATLERRRRAVGPLGQMVAGAVVIGLGWSLLAIAAALWPDARVSATWPIVALVLEGIGFMLYWPPLLALVSGHAPPQSRGLMMGVTFVSLALANYLAGWIGTFYEPLGPARFWALNGWVSLVSIALFALAGPRLTRALAPPA